MIGLGDGPSETTRSETTRSEATRSEAICSRAGCRVSAAWNVNWRNPRIHATDRVKIWLACDEHVDYLRDYLLTRDLPVVVTPLAELVEAVPDR